MNETRTLISKRQAPILRRRRTGRRAFAVVRWLLALVLLGAAAGGATWWFLQPLPYVVDSYIEFEPDRPAPFNDGVHSDVLVAKSLGDAHVALLKSASVLEAALCRQDIASLGLAKDVRSGAKWLEDLLEVEQVADGHVICVRLRAADSERADELAILLNAIVSQYVDTVVTQSRMNDSQELESLTDLIKQLRKDLLAQRVEIEELADVASEPTAEERARLAILQELAAAKTELLAEYSAEEYLQRAWQKFASMDEANRDGFSYPVRVIQRALVHEE